MSLERQQQLFDACLDADGDEERERLLAACTDPALREQVRALLRAHAEAPDSVYAPEFAAQFPNIAAPHQIGPYRVLERIGEGAMGDVFLAEQQAPVRRRVAVKILKFGLATREVMARFEFERQTLAMLAHGNIARIFDAGATGDGRPYFAMEYVPGIAITRYCDERALGVDARLALYAQVCAGVQHAHLRGIIHRDLKPSNILVAEVDGQPVPKIIDFGIAKAATPTSAAGEAHTRFGHLLGTPDYMSPEQVQLSPLDIDARTDVYSLGVLLYELLTGELPHRVTGDALNPAMILEQIAKHEARRPSVVAGADTPAGRAQAALRGSTPPALAARLRGDLDWIVLKAMAKNRQRRYESPAALLADLRRHASDEPVSAGPPSKSYLLRKFVRRHRLAVSVLAAAFAAALVFGSAMTWFALQAAAERDRANQQAEAAQRVTAFTAGLFELANPALAKSSEISARQLLDLGVRRLELQTAAQRPETRAALLEAAGNAYRGVGAYPEAERLLTSVLQLRAGAGLDSPARAQTLLGLARVKDDEGEFARAAELARESIALLERQSSPSADTLVLARVELADILRHQNQLGEAAALAQAAAAQVAAPDARARALAVLGRVRLAQGQLPEAERLLREAYAIQLQEGGPLSERTFEVKSWLADALVTLGQSARAEPLLRELVDDARKVYGGEHPVVALALNNLANAISDLPDERAEAEQAYLAAIDILVRVHGRMHPEVGNSYNNLGALYNGMQQWAKADRAYQQAIDIRGRTLGENHPEYAASMHGRALALIRLGRLPEAEALLRRSTDVFARALGPSHWRTANSRLYLGYALARRGQSTAGRQQMQQAYGALTAALGADHWRVQRARGLLAELHVAVD